MSDEVEGDLGEWCAEHREFYTEGTPCPGCAALRAEYVRGARNALAELCIAASKVDKSYVSLDLMRTLVDQIERGEWPRGEAPNEP